MFLNVDLIGEKAVCKYITLSKLTRFTIYRQGANNGSTPVYECNFTDQNIKAVKVFQDWCKSMTEFNPYNSQCYEILLYNKISEGTEEGSDDEENKRAARKQNKMRASFSLASQNNFQSGQMNGFPGAIPGGDFQTALDNAMQQYALKQENINLKKELEELQNEEEEEEEEASADKLGKLVEIFKHISKSKKTTGAKINNDLEEDLDAEEEEEEEEGKLDDDDDEPKTKKMSPQAKAEKLKKINKAIAFLNKVEGVDLGEDMMCLARFAKNKPEMFIMAIKQVRVQGAK